jgi:hypothetical protein
LSLHRFRLYIVHEVGTGGQVLVIHALCGLRLRDSVERCLPVKVFVTTTG